MCMWNRVYTFYDFFNLLKILKYNNIWCIINCMTFNSPHCIYISMFAYKHC